MKKSKKLYSELSARDRLKLSLEEDSMVYRFYKWLRGKNIKNTR